VDSSGRKNAQFNRIRQVASMWPHEKAHWRHLANTIEPSFCSLMSNYFDHLLDYKYDDKLVGVVRHDCISVKMCFELL